MAKLCCVFTWLPLAQRGKAKRLRASGKGCSSGHGWSPPVGFCPLWWLKFNSTPRVCCVNVEGRCELFVGSHSFSPCIPSCLFFFFSPLLSFPVSPLSQLLFHLCPKFPVPPKTFRSSLVAIGAQEVTFLKPGFSSLLLIFETTNRKVPANENRRPVRKLEPKEYYWRLWWGGMADLGLYFPEWVIKHEAPQDVYEKAVLCTIWNLRNATAHILF